QSSVADGRLTESPEERLKPNSTIQRLSAIINLLNLIIIKVSAVYSFSPLLRSLQLVFLSRVQE
ncbi:MAG: hypothetical protein SVU69_05555, partial [Pseudomonadota bacterium]|nr:hypothetical protein [Pseudomonadota bacterium]